MNKLNPIYILALVITIFIISLVKQNQKKDELNNIELNYEQIQTKAKHLNEYKQKWFDKNETIKDLNFILKDSFFRKENITKIENEKHIRVKIESKNQVILNKFLNKVLNKKFILNKLIIEKNSISFEVMI